LRESGVRQVTSHAFEPSAPQVREQVVSQTVSLAHKNIFFGQLIEIKRLPPVHGHFRLGFLVFCKNTLQ